MTEETATKLEGLKTSLAQEAQQVRLDLNELKSGGFIKQTQRDLFTVRLRCPGGRVDAAKLSKAAELARKYGRGEVHLSVRQSIEIPYVHYQHLEELAREVKEVDWSVASCGPRVRVPTACAGCSYNPNALVDTQGLCREVDRRFFGTPTGHGKFKMSLSGCPIDCFRTREMDLGFQGIVEPLALPERCTACGLCLKACEDGALKMSSSGEGEPCEGPPVRDPARCTLCGDCIKVCPFDAIVPGKLGWLIRVGGKHGKHPLFAYEVAQFVSDEGVLALIERTLSWYRENGRGKERIGTTLGRLGLAKYLIEVVHPLGLEVIESSEERRRFAAGGNFYHGIA